MNFMRLLGRRGITFAHQGHENGVTVYVPLRGQEPTVYVQNPRDF